MTPTVALELSSAMQYRKQDWGRTMQMSASRKSTVLDVVREGPSYAYGYELPWRRAWVGNRKHPEILQHRDRRTNIFCGSVQQRGATRQVHCWRSPVHGGMCFSGQKEAVCDPVSVYGWPQLIFSVPLQKARWQNQCCKGKTYSIPFARVEWYRPHPNGYCSYIYPW